MILALDAGAEPVRAALSRELARVWNVEQRHPVGRGVVLRGRLRVWRDDRREIQQLARRRLHPLRIDEAISADPDVVVRLRQIGNQVAAAVVRNDDLRQARRQLACFRDHPDARLGSFRARDDAADVVVVDGDRVAALLLRGDDRRGTPHERETNSESHLVSPLAIEH